MDFEKLYSKLPDIIKYNPKILDFFMKTSKKLIKLNNKSDISNSQQELLELIFLNSEFQVSGILREVQLLYLELMKFIDNVCDKYDIEYWITGGTLLGAVRHGGFIPWDDDFDINMMRNDYEKFIEVIPLEISKHEYLKQECGLSLLRTNHENYFKDFNSVYDFEGNKELFDSSKFLFLQFAWLKPYIKIDVFPRDYILEDKLDYFKKNYVSTKYEFNQNVKKGKKDFDKEFKIQYENLGYTRQKSKYMDDGIDSLQLSPLKIHEVDKIFPLKKINFDKYEFKCPKDPNHFLEGLFGPNYMSMPKIIEHHNITSFIESQFNSHDEINEKFRKDIKYLNDINENFD